MARSRMFTLLLIIALAAAPVLAAGARATSSAPRSIEPVAGLGQPVRVGETVTIRTNSSNVSFTLVSVEPGGSANATIGGVPRVLAPGVPVPIGSDGTMLTLVGSTGAGSAILDVTPFGASGPLPPGAVSTRAQAKNASANHTERRAASNATAPPTPPSGTGRSAASPPARSQAPPSVFGRIVSAILSIFRLRP